MTVDAERGRMSEVQLVGLEFLRQQHEVVSDIEEFYGRPETPVRPPDKESSMRLNWNWWHTQALEIRVMLEIELHPTDDRPEFAAVFGVASFTLSEDATLPGIRGFAQFGATNIMYPFLRERIGSLTAFGPFGAKMPEIVNIRALMEQFDPAAATGWAQGEDEEASMSDTSD